MEEQQKQPYTGVERRQSQQAYEGDDRRKNAHAEDASSEKEQRWMRQQDQQDKT